ncbi:peptidyl-prolyl cis-trans isomerase [Thioalkalicoccus limnaeus]|uniref:peptidylprolyl isomerase n=1 Tax=Thioalkalicoccus limnaeus TaxID=120681 RepID=A0ABV4BBQ1_9GAMM
MKTLRPTILAASLTLAVAWPIAAPWAADTPTDETLIATINGQELPLDLFRLFYFERLQQEQATNTSNFQEQAFNEFVNLVVAAQEGQRRGLDRHAEVRQALALQQLKILSNATIQSIAQEQPPSDAELQEAYRLFVADAERTEYKARHILVDDEEEAKRLIAELDKGAAFAELASRHSLGPTGERGGELEWFSADQMVQPFAAALQELAPGRYTKQPVRTQFGWHVILLEETRKAQPPTFDEARPYLVNALQRDKVAETIMNLRAAATVDLNAEVVKLKTPDAD